MSKLGDWEKGPHIEHDAWIVDYKVRRPGEKVVEGHMRILVEKDAGKESAIRRLRNRVLKKFPEATVEIVKIHLPGRTPSGLFVPPGYEDYT